MFIGEVDISNMLSAFNRFENFRMNEKTDQEKAGTIHAFEYSFELVWKLMKRLLAERGNIANSPRETIRMAALEGFIADPELWFDFLKKRNLTTHSYHENIVNMIMPVLPIFSGEVKSFLKNIGVPDGAY